MVIQGSDFARMMVVVVDEEDNYCGCGFVDNNRN